MKTAIDNAMRELSDATIAIARAQKRQNAAIHALADALAAAESIDWRWVRLWQVKLDAGTLAIRNMIAEHRAAQARLDGLCWAHGAGGDAGGDAGDEKPAVDGG